VRPAIAAFVIAYTAPPANGMRSALTLPIMMTRPPAPMCDAGGLRRDECGAHVDGDHAVEVLEREPLERPHDQDARVVHEHVEPPERRDGLRDRLPDRAGVGRVGADREALPTGRLDGPGDLVGLLWRARERDRDVRAVVREATRDRGADAARAARDQGRFARERGVRSFHCAKSSVRFMYRSVQM
jgi:hypothetical protein